MKNKVFLKIKPLITSLAMAVFIAANFSKAALATPNEKIAIRNIITQMNQAFTSRETDKLLATFGEGAVKIDLFPAHVKSGKRSSTAIKTADLTKRWQTVTAILFKSTNFYERVAKNMKVHADNNLALVWATIETRSQSIQKGAKIKSDRYSEVYLLRFIKNNWKITALTNNRQASGLNQARPMK